MDLCVSHDQEANQKQATFKLKIQIVKIKFNILK